MQNWPVKSRERLGQDHVGGVGHDVGRAAHLHAFVAGERVSDRGGGDPRARPERVDGDAVLAKLARHAEHAHAHAEFRHRVGDVV